MILPRWPGWRHLPRESRDTLFLLGVIAWTVLPHVSHLRVVRRADLDRAALARGTRLDLRRFAGTLDPDRGARDRGRADAWSYRTLLGKEPGITLAVVLMA